MNIDRVPILNFLRRYWLLLIIFGALAALIFSDTLFQKLGMLIYLPSLTLGAVLTALLIRNIFNSETTDKDADDGTFARLWRELPPEVRVRLTVHQFIAYYLGACWIAAAISR